MSIYKPARIYFKNLFLKLFKMLTSKLTTVFPLVLSISLSTFTDGALESHPRIIGGENATEAEFPFMVSLQMKPPFGEQYHFCGGSIYFNNMIATSASCVYNRIASQIEVVAGIHNLSYSNPEIQRRSVIDISIHPDYDPDRNLNDIALLILNRPMPISSHVDIMPYPSFQFPEIYVGNCTVLGWGSNSQLLQKLNMTLVPNPTCASIYENIQDIIPSMICARGAIPEKTQGPCTGDNGGPLICNQLLGVLPEPRPVVAGIVSWSMIPCGNSGYPSIYTNISQILFRKGDYDYDYI